MVTYGQFEKRAHCVQSRHLYDPNQKVQSEPAIRKPEGSLSGYFKSPEITGATTRRTGQRVKDFRVNI